MKRRAAQASGEVICRHRLVIDIPVSHPTRATSPQAQRSGAVEEQRARCPAWACCGRRAGSKASDRLGSRQEMRPEPLGTRPINAVGTCSRACSCPPDHTSPTPGPLHWQPPAADRPPAPSERPTRSANSPQRLCLHAGQVLIVTTCPESTAGSNACPPSHGQHAPPHLRSTSACCKHGAGASALCPQGAGCELLRSPDGACLACSFQAEWQSVVHNQCCLCWASPLPLPAVSALVPEPFLPLHPPLPQPAVLICLQPTGVQDPATRGRQRLAQRRVARERQGAWLGLGVLVAGQGMLVGWLGEVTSLLKRAARGLVGGGLVCCSVPTVLEACAWQAVYCRHLSLSTSAAGISDLPPRLRFSPADAAWWHKGRHWRFAWRTQTREGPALQPLFILQPAVQMQPAVFRRPYRLLGWRRGALTATNPCPYHTRSGELFGVAPVPLGQAHIAVEQAADSSRNFVLRLEVGACCFAQWSLSCCCTGSWVLTALLGCPCLVAARWQITARPAHAEAQLIADYQPTLLSAPPSAARRMLPPSGTPLWAFLLQSAPLPLISMCEYWPIWINPVEVWLVCTRGRACIPSLSCCVQCALCLLIGCHSLCRRALAAW